MLCLWGVFFGNDFHGLYLGKFLTWNLDTKLKVILSSPQKLSTIFPSSLVVQTLCIKIWTYDFFFGNDFHELYFKKYLPEKAHLDIKLKIIVGSVKSFPQFFHNFSMYCNMKLCFLTFMSCISVLDLKSPFGNEIIDNCMLYQKLSTLFPPFLIWGYDQKVELRIRQRQIKYCSFKKFSNEKVWFCVLNRLFYSTPPVFGPPCPLLNLRVS